MRFGDVAVAVVAAAAAANALLRATYWDEHERC